MKFYCLTHAALNDPLLNTFTTDDAVYGDPEMERGDLGETSICIIGDLYDGYRMVNEQMNERGHDTGYWYYRRNSRSGWCSDIRIDGSIKSFKERP